MAIAEFIIDTQRFSIETLKQLTQTPHTLKLDNAVVDIVSKNRAFLERKLAEPNARYYGINTGFGALCDVKISNENIEQLQENLVMSHACGMGDEVKPEVAKLMLLLKIKGLSLGSSGVCVETIQKLVEFYNADVIPLIWEVGSLGASGDLAPLAHMSLPLLGMGEVRYKGERMKTADALKQANIQSIKLHSKEGLALLNGTQFMSAWGSFSVMESERVEKLADLTAAISVDAFNAQTAPFHPAIQKIRNHTGQMESAANVLKFLEGSEIATQPKNNVQDPYSFRCVPQVHGAVRGVIEHVKSVFDREINAVTDNPLVFEDEDLIISGGNFHGEPLALP
jgi:histidine ammonia-lyase